MQGFARLRPHGRLDIFLDEENLAGDVALWDELDEHLLGSEYLIVLTHYDLPDQSGVRREVQTWLRHKGPNNIIIVLIDELPLAEVPPPFDGLNFEPLIIEERKYRNHSRVGGLIRVPANDRRTMYARIVSTITSRPLPKVLRQHARWVRAVALAACIALAFVAVGVWQSSAAERDRERALASRINGEDLVGQGFTGSALRDATYTLKAFDRADFSDSSMTDIEIVESTGVEAKFDRATLERVTFEKSVFTDASFSCGGIVDLAATGEPCVGAKLHNVTITGGSRLDGANFEFAHIDRMRVESSSLIGASFVGATGQGLVISDSDVRDAVFDLSTIEGLSFVRVCFNDKTAWPAGMDAPELSLQRSCK